MNGVWQTTPESWSGLPVYTRAGYRLYRCNARSESDATSADRWHIDVAGGCQFFGISKGPVEQVRKWFHLEAGQWRPIKGAIQPPSALTSGTLHALDFPEEMINGVWIPSASEHYSGRPVYERSPNTTCMAGAFLCKAGGKWGCMRKGGGCSSSSKDAGGGGVGCLHNRSGSPPGADQP